MIIFDLDDFFSFGENNCLAKLFDMKRHYPNLKVTLFAVLGQCGSYVFDEIRDTGWIDLAAHGMFHNENTETYSWDEARWKYVLDEYEKYNFQHIFKAPNWQMNELGYRELHNRGWAVAVRESHIKDLPPGMRYYCFETTPGAVHGHTWLLNDHKEKGWFKDWNEKSEFDYVKNYIVQK